jgi:hypothetical protein
MPGFQGTLRMVPEHRFAVIILTNKEGRGLTRTAEKALELLLPVKAAAPAAAKPAQPISAAEMARYAGTYSNPNRWAMDVLVKEGQLFLKWFGTDLPLTKIGEARFAVALPGAPQREELVFGLDAQGRAAYLHMLLWAFKKLGNE